MKHTDPNGIAGMDWASVIAALPPSARRAFDKERARQSEQAKRQLEAYAEGQGGLTTYDPEHGGWIECERLMLDAFAEYVARGDLYARQRGVGVVEAAKQISS